MGPVRIRRPAAIFALAMLWASSLPVVQSSQSDTKQKRKTVGTARASAFPPSALRLPPSDKTLVVVNGTAIDERELQVTMRFRGVPASVRPAVRTVFLERLIDEQLMREFLDSRKATAPKLLLERAVDRVLQTFRDKGLKPEAELKKLGLDEAALRRKLALPIAWNAYARGIIGDREIREHFTKHRARYDGTRLRARQIVLKLPQDSAGRLKALKELDAVRREILAGTISFEDAAKKHSTAPSKTRGGDVGFFAYRGKMPREITQAAFSLKENEVSKPFVTQFGVHILQVTDRRPGQFSLEDARPEIFRELAQQRWKERVAKLRKSATIERKSAAK